MTTKYSYKLYANKRYTEKKYMTYTRVELMEMTTFQLRNICYKEKLITGLINTLTRDELIEKILRYRGAEEHLLIKEKTRWGALKESRRHCKKYLKNTTFR
ncbi:hypothetical protein OL548_26840 [Lysinibacillus sp. MHQ-1]|nr:hypothetical protein OL548_26840 [Lysinibacillus sp. MHQ-1]